MRCTTPLPLLLALAALTVTACSSDKNNSGSKPKPGDTGVNVPADTGVDPGIDGGLGLDGGSCNPLANPNGCVPNEQISGLDCRCLGICTTGYIYRTNPNRCEVDTNFDGGFPDSGTDGGPRPDGGPGADAGFPDTGIPPAMACTTNANCTMPNEECVQPQNGDLCAGQTDCICIQACTPNQGTSNCAAMEACLWLWPGTRGLCIPEAPGGGQQNQACTAMFDPGGNRTQDSCATNFYCWGATAAAPTGLCARFCPPGGTAICPTLGNYTCPDLGANPGEIGLCLEPPPAFTDLGNACTSGPNCMSNFCSQTLAGSCSHQCDGLAQCPTGSLCLNTQQEGPICIGECVFGAAGDTTCAGRNPDSVCERLGTAPDTFDICIPKCTMDAECGAPPATCNVGTGHCN